MGIRPPMPDRPAYRIHITRAGAGRRRFDDALIRRAVRWTLRAHGRQGAVVGIHLLDDERIAELNENFLGHAGPTDVITFPLGDSADAGILEGDIAVSVETAAREAAERGHPFVSEVLLYVVHGVLHLLGYDDKTRRSAAAMRAAEERALGSLGRAGVYAGGRRA